MEEGESQSSARACGLRSRIGRSVVLLGEGHSRLAQLLRCCVLYFVYLFCCFVSFRLPVTVVVFVVVVATFGLCFAGDRCDSVSGMRV